MPTKLNSAGKQQNYIPAGNGDPSGEYGTNNGSGNKHIKIDNGKAEPNVIDDNNKDFTGKTPPKQETKTKEDNKPNVIDDNFSVELKDKGGKNKGKNLKEKINNVNKSKIPSEKIEENIRFGTLPMQQLIEIVFENDKFNIKDGSASVSAFGDTLFINEKDLKEQPSYYSKGGVVYHELGHALDGTFELGMGGTWKNPKILWASNTVELSNGKTLADTLKAENTYNKKNDIFKKMSEEYNNRKKELFKENGVDLDQLNKRIDELDKSFVEAREQYGKDNNLTWENNNKKWDYYYNLRDSNKEYKQLKDTKWDIERKIDKTLCVEFGDLSDIRSSMGYETFGMGHSQSYWKDTSNKGKEFFAECCSAKATNPKSWELLKKYYPNSCKAFEELTSKMKKGELKKKR